MRHSRFPLAGRLLDPLQADRVQRLSRLGRNPSGGLAALFHDPRYDFVMRCRGAATRSIAKLYHSGKVSHVITQNIDDLHRVSGVPEESIIELHGNGTYAKCLSCGERYELAWARARIESEKRPPYCLACAGIIKTATISFGQAMPDQEMARRACRDLQRRSVSRFGLVAPGFPGREFPGHGQEQPSQAGHRQSRADRSRCARRSGDPGRARRCSERLCRPLVAAGTNQLSGSLCEFALCKA